MHKDTIFPGKHQIAEMRGEFVDVGGMRLYYYAAGTRGGGDPVVLLHGFPTSSRLWHSVARDFRPGHRLVIVDLPGYGRSDAPTPARTSLGAHAAAVRALLDDLGIARAVVAGHGLGGGVAQAFAIQWPTRVSALALISSAGFGVAPHGMARVARALGPLARLLPPALLASLVHGSMRRGFEDPERSRLTLDTCRRHFTTPTGRDALAAHLRTLGAGDTRSWSRRLGEIQAPTAVIWGEDDPFYPIGLGQRIAAAIPDATFEIIRGAAHFVPEDQPEQLRRALDLLIARATA
jgi:pimeloyl-ACP methyl ester carboxylesterase